MADYTDEQWEELARRWRQAAGMDDQVRLDAPEFVRWLKRAGYIKDYVCVPDRELPTAEGKYDPDQGIIFFPQTAWDSAERREHRGNWSLIHEATHAILNHKEVRFRAQAAAQNRLSRQTNKDELEAHRLTACILAPFDKADFKPGMTIDDIRNRFGLGFEAARRRLEEFERMYRRKHGLRRPLPPGVVDFLAEQKRKGYPVTSLDIEAPLPRPQTQFDGDPCPSCGALKLVRSGLGRKCECCGARLGDD